MLCEMNDCPYVSVDKEKRCDLPEGLESEEYSKESQASEIDYGCVLVGVRCDAGVQGVIQTNPLGKQNGPAFFHRHETKTVRFFFSLFL
jgi:hypothetical protein